jgi:hypothetical protein
MDCLSSECIELTCCEVSGSFLELMSNAKSKVCINGVEINSVYVAVFLRTFMWRNFSYFKSRFVPLVRRSVWTAL